MALLAACREHVHFRTSETAIDLLNAMSLWQLGRKVEARAGLAAASQVIENELLHANGNSLSPLQEWLQCQIFHREAIALILATPSKSLPTPTTSPSSR